MKFNEKLIELRRKEGLSQEELGYRLNVTRQTISKWELGQTTPEMDKLVEISKIFNISVDELINESEVTANPNPIIEDQPIKNESPKNNKIAIIIVGALIIIVILIIVKMVSAVSIFNKVTDEVTNAQGNIFEKFFGMIDKMIDTQEDINGNAEDIFGNVEGIIGEQLNGVNTNRFNGTLELYNGSNSGSALKRLLDEIITSNKKEDRKITVKYTDTETEDSEQIKNLKTSIKESNNFEVSFEYDEEGYINEVLIEKVVTEFEIKRFNNSFEIHSGSGLGADVINVLDDIITSNKTEDRKIAVKYKDIETQNEDEIKNIKRNFGTFDNCEITYEYDAQGFIYKAIIEKL